MSTQSQGSVLVLIDNLCARSHVGEGLDDSAITIELNLGKVLSERLTVDSCGRSRELNGGTNLFTLEGLGTEVSHSSRSSGLCTQLNLEVVDIQIVSVAIRDSVHAKVVVARLADDEVLIFKDGPFSPVNIGGLNDLLGQCINLGSGAHEHLDALGIEVAASHDINGEMIDLACLQVDARRHEPFVSGILIVAIYYDTLSNAPGVAVVVAVEDAECSLLFLSVEGVDIRQRVDIITGHD